MNTIHAEPREDFGKNASRRLRHGGRIPAVVYGGEGQAIPVTLDPKAITQVLYSEAGHNAVLTLEIKGRAPARVLLSEWQVDPVHGGLLHVDLFRISADTRLKLKVPIHLTGESYGVKTEGGILEFITREVEIECLPDDIPDHIAVDITEFKIGSTLRASDLPLSAKAKLLTDPTRMVAHLVALRAEEEKPAEEAAATAEGAAEPEVIRKGKGEEDEEGEGETDKKGEKKAEKKPEKKGDKK
ncbi:MAG TPA: 50S ribosomal protein L25 [Terriglobia bacterium]|jgi:large subunit ribosomal protein L25|nr:50S ribosomal protein L25 [Terriglobia bacterium]